MRTRADLTTLVLTKLADTAQTYFAASAVTYAIDESLKEFSQTFPHIVLATFKIESRSGTATSTSAGNLIDTTKSQFLAADATNEKVIHNTTDDTRAVVKTCNSTSSLALSVDIMALGENYEIYNTRCTNNHQIYIGDFPNWIGIERIEYPQGSRRNWEEIINKQVVELDIDSVYDSNSTLTPLPQVDVYVYFRLTHVLTPLTDTSATLGATAAVSATTLAMSSLQTSGTITAGDEFFMAGQRTAYVVTANTAIASNTSTITFWPPLEANISSSATIATFVQSSLKQPHEELFADLVTANLALYAAPKYIPGINITGANTWQEYITLGERLRARVDARMRPFRQTTIYSRG